MAAVVGAMCLGLEPWRPAKHRVGGSLGVVWFCDICWTDWLFIFVYFCLFLRFVKFYVLWSS